MDSIKKQKLAATIKGIAAEFFLKNADSFLNNIIITQSETSLDGKTIIIWVRVESNKLAEFTKRQDYFQKQLRVYVATHSKLRYCPSILLKVDNSFEAIEKIEKLIS